jgi:hypothetical protein
VISHCMRLYFRFPLSFREVEELMLQRGVIVSCETVRRWCAKFGQAYANGPRRRRPRPEDKWQGKAGPISVPRLERSTIRPASIETRACHLSCFGSPAHPGSSAGSDTGAASIGSGSVHVTAHAFHPARPSANRVRVRTRLPARPRQVSALQHLAGGCVLSSWRMSRQRSRTPGCPDPVSYGLMSRPPTVRNGSHRTRRCRRYGRKI